MGTLNVKFSKISQGLALQLDGTDLSGLNMEKLKDSVEYRLACLQANRCNAKDQTVREKLSCVNERGRRRFEGAKLSNFVMPQIEIKSDKNKVDIQIKGLSKDLVKVLENNPDLTARIKAEVACARANKCTDINQKAADKIKCITATAERRFK